MHTDALKTKREKIEMGLPGFIRSILFHLPDTRKGGDIKINQSDALSALARDMDVKARENIRKQLDKRPGRMKLATISLVIAAVGMLLCVIAAHLFQSIGGMF